MKFLKMSLILKYHKLTKLKNIRHYHQLTMINDLKFLNDKIKIQVPINFYNLHNNMEYQTIY